MKYYFLRTVADGSRIRIRALKGQTLMDGTEIDPSMNVQGNMSIRSMYPVGTVYGTTSMSAGSSFYKAGPLFALDLSPYEYRDPGHVPDTQMKEAYLQYQRGQEETKVKTTLFDSFFEEEDARAAARGEAIPAPSGKTRKAVKTAATEAPKTEPAKRTVKRSPAATLESSPDLYKKLSSDSAFARPTVEKDGFCVEKDNWDMIMNNIVDGQSTMLLGPTGTGKTELVMLACEKLGLECNVFNMGTIFDPISELLGVHRLVGGSSKFDYAKFAQDVQKPGVILLDELSRAPVTTNNVLFPCLDGRRILPVDMAGGDDVRNIKIHPKCVFFATANVGAEYTGTMSMDRALVGRFFPLELDYMKKDDESRVLQKRMKISKTDADNLSAVAESVRNKFARTELSASLSTRETLRAARLIANGWPVAKAMEMTFLPLFEGTRVEGERSVVAQIIMSR